MKIEFKTNPATPRHTELPSTKNTLGARVLLFGASLLALHFAAPLHALDACDRQELAEKIRDNSRIYLATTHPSGVVDSANARQNILDTANGNQARRSNYGTAPGGTVWLDPRLLNCMDRLAEVYGYT